MDRKDLIAYLHNHSDAKYREFHTKLVPNIDNIIGVRSPILKTLAKEIAKGDYIPFLNYREFLYAEEKMLYCLVLGAIKTDFETLTTYLKEFVPYIDSWAVCDSLCSSLKEVKKHRQSLLPYFLDCCHNSEEFTIRFGVVMLMSYYSDTEHIEILLKEFDNITNDAYYVRMAVAWALSVCFVKCRERTLEYLCNNNMDKWTHNKSIQKIIESLRVSSEDKEIVRALKRR